MKARAMMVAIPCVVAFGIAARLIGSHAATSPANWHASLNSAGALQRIVYPSGPAGFADVVDVVKPAVIGIRTKRTASSNELGLALPSERFGQFDTPQKEPDLRPAPDTQGSPDSRPTNAALGSGFFISADGYAVTNNHVLEGSQTAEIRTDDQRIYAAKVVGTDPVSDLALLKVDGRNDFPFVALASKPPRVGDWVLAVGNPFGLGGTVTAGIVSARERNIGISSYDDLVQIDAPINQGASGGPTFDGQGHVIGVNTMILSPSGGSIGIAFAIPAETVNTVIPQLKEKGSVTRGWLGVQIQPLTVDVADSLGLKAAQGVLVAESHPGGPASKAGIGATDIITSVNGEAVKDGRDLVKMINTAIPGTSVNLGVLRQAGEKTVSVTLGELPRKQDGAPAQPPEHRGDASRIPEIKLAPANSIPGMGSEGVIVIDVDLSGRAAGHGLEQGDVIFEVNGKKVRTPDDVRNALSEARNEGKRTALMRLNSGQTIRFVAVPVDAG